MNYVTVDSQLRFVAQLVRRCPTRTLRHAFVQAMRDWCNQTHWLRKDVVQSTANTQSGIEGEYLVLLDGEDAEFLEVVAIRDNIKALDPSKSRPTEFSLCPSDPSTWDNTAAPNPPRVYAYKPEGMFNLYPAVLDRDYDLRITAVLQPRDGALRVPDAPLIKSSRDIEAGALESLFSIPGEPWSNEAKAANWGKTFRSGINNAKADAQRRYNTGAQRVRPQRFIRGSGQAARGYW